jgi:ABC-type cobalt transport system substrate-binding protein
MNSKLVMTVWILSFLLLIATLVFQYQEASEYMGVDAQQKDEVFNGDNWQFGWFKK